jgi:hypothetical protein
METTQKIRWYKKLTILLLITTIIPTSILLMGLKSSIIPAQSPVIITQETGSQYVNNYISTAAPTNGVVRAVIIEASVLSAMNSIAKQYPATPSYRVYFGKDNAGAQVSVVVGITSTGLDMTLPVYCSSRTGNNLCPPMCDAAGVIDPTN